MASKLVGEVKSLSDLLKSVALRLGQFNGANGLVHVQVRVHHVEVEVTCGHVVVCLFVVVDIANIQQCFAYPNIHAKKVCIYAR